jgi:hypothetical protein
MVNPKPVKLNPGEKRYAFKIVEEQRMYTTRDAKWEGCSPFVKRAIPDDVLNGEKPFIAREDRYDVPGYGIYGEDPDIVEVRSGYIHMYMNMDGVLRDFNWFCMSHDSRYHRYSIYLCEIEGTGESLEYVEGYTEDLYKSCAAKKITFKRLLAKGIDEARSIRPYDVGGNLIPAEEYAK